MQNIIWHKLVEHMDLPSIYHTYSPRLNLAPAKTAEDRKGRQLGHTTRPWDHPRTRACRYQRRLGYVRANLASAATAADSRRHSGRQRLTHRATVGDSGRQERAAVGAYHKPPFPEGRRIRVGESGGVHLRVWTRACFGVQGFGFRVSGLGLRDQGFGFRVPGFGFRVSGFGFRV